MSADEVTFAYEGLWTHMSCGACGAMCEVEDDLQNGEEVQCDACGAAGTLERST